MKTVIVIVMMIIGLTGTCVCWGNESVKPPIYTVFIDGEKIGETRIVTTGNIPLIDGRFVHPATTSTVEWRSNSSQKYANLWGFGGTIFFILVLMSGACLLSILLDDDPLYGGYH